MSHLIEKSTHFKEQADVLLKQTGLTEDLEKFGEVHFTGAYAGDVMMDGDIDITVVKEKDYSSEEVLEILKYLYLKGSFRSYFIKGDWNDVRMGQEFPNGHYVGLKQRLNEEKWKVDMWFVSKKEFETRKKDFLDISNLTLDADQKELILECKEYRNKNNLNISGQEIYEAVLERNIKKVEELSQDPGKI